MSIATEIQRLQTAKANIKVSIEAKGVSVPSSTTLDGYPSIITNIPTFDPYNGHDYVEIGGLKWATMNIGASSITDYGLYFQWGDTTGYTRTQVGASETTNAKPFCWADYKFGNGTTSPGATGMTKYNSADTKTVLDICDDTARANMGGLWRMPTPDEFVALVDAANIDFTDDYQGSGVVGFTFIAKTDSSKVLFFPCTSVCRDGRAYPLVDPDMGSASGAYWSNSVDSSSVEKAQCMLVSTIFWVDFRNNKRYFGGPVRGVLSE